MKAEDLNELSAKFQDECHKIVSEAMELNKKVEYQDATNAWMFMKLAELQLQINNKQSKPKVYQR